VALTTMVTWPSSEQGTRCVEPAPQPRAVITVHHVMFSL
jgi:hypothetical protein